MSLGRKSMDVKGNKDGKFLKWYRKKYNLNSDKEETSQEEWLEGYHKWKGKSKKERCPHN